MARASRALLAGAAALATLALVGAGAHASFTASVSIRSTISAGTIALDTVACKVGHSNDEHGTGHGTDGSGEGRGRTCVPDDENPGQENGENESPWSVSVGPADSPLSGFTNASGITITTENAAANVAVTVTNAGNLTIHSLVLAAPTGAFGETFADRRVNISVAGHHLVSGETLAELSGAPLDLLAEDAELAPGGSLSLVISLSGGPAQDGPGAVTFTLAGADV